MSIDLLMKIDAELSEANGNLRAICQELEHHTALLTRIAVQFDAHAKSLAQVGQALEYLAQADPPGVDTE